MWRSHLGTEIADVIEAVEMDAVRLLTASVCCRGGDCISANKQMGSPLGLSRMPDRNRNRAKAESPQCWCHWSWYTGMARMSQKFPQVLRKEKISKQEGRANCFINIVRTNITPFASF
jgi:hypothetical protein